MTDYNEWIGCIAEVDAPGYWDGDSISSCEECSEEIKEGDPYVCTYGQRTICQSCAAEEVDAEIRNLKSIASDLQLSICS